MTRADVAKMLRADATYAEIVEALHVSHGVIAATRKELGLPPKRRPYRPADSAEQAFRDRTEELPDGHLRWTGYTSEPGHEQLLYGGRRESARIFAFRSEYGREPIGYVRPGCGMTGCVAPRHLEDRPMREKNRETYRAIFGDQS